MVRSDEVAVTGPKGVKQLHEGNIMKPPRSLWAETGPGQEPLSSSVWSAVVRTSQGWRRQGLPPHPRLSKSGSAMNRAAAEIL